MRYSKEHGYYQQPNMGDTCFPVDKPASKDSGIRNVPFLAFSRHWLAADRMFVGLGQTQLSINTNATTLLKPITLLQLGKPWKTSVTGFIRLSGWVGGTFLQLSRPQQRKGTYHHEIHHTKYQVNTIPNAKYTIPHTKNVILNTKYIMKYHINHLKYKIHSSKYSMIGPLCVATAY